MLSESFIITVITAVVGPVLVLYIANRIKNMRPKSDRIDTAFAEYEKIIKWQGTEIIKLRTESSEKDAEIVRLRAELRNAEPSN